MHRLLTRHKRAFPSHVISPKTHTYPSGFQSNATRHTPVKTHSHAHPDCHSAQGRDRSKILFDGIVHMSYDVRHVYPDVGQLCAVCAQHLALSAEKEGQSQGTNSGNKATQPKAKGRAYGQSATATPTRPTPVQTSPYTARGCAHHTRHPPKPHRSLGG